MLRAAAAIALTSILAAASAGCGAGGGGSSATSLPSKSGVHGGTAFPLPNDRGYAEVVIEPQKVTKAGREVVLAVYFLKPDLKAALEPAPSGVAAKLAVPGQEAPATPTFAPKPLKPGDGRFATEVGPYDVDEIRGEVTGSLDGQAFAVPIAIR